MIKSSWTSSTILEWFWGGLSSSCKSNAVSCSFVLQFDCCGVEDNGYKMYFQNTNATAGDDFPQSCCATGGNLTCPKTVGQAERANPKVFKKTVRKCRTNVELNWLD